jgi:hypothetical protein
VLASHRLARAPEVMADLRKYIARSISSAHANTVPSAIATFTASERVLGDPAVHTTTKKNTIPVDGTRARCDGADVERPLNTPARNTSAVPICVAT